MEEVRLKKEQLLSIGSDGPNVDNTIWKGTNDHLKGLVQFMPCNVHVVHNGFKHGLFEYGQFAEQLAFDLFYWFKAHPACKEDYFRAQTDLGFDKQLLVVFHFGRLLRSSNDSKQNLRRLFLNKLQTIC